MSVGGPTAAPHPHPPRRVWPVLQLKAEIHPLTRETPWPVLQLKAEIHPPGREKPVLRRAALVLRPLALADLRPRLGHDGQPWSYDRWLLQTYVRDLRPRCRRARCSSSCVCQLAIHPTPCPRYFRRAAQRCSGTCCPRRCSGTCCPVHPMVPRMPMHPSPARCGPMAGEPVGSKSGGGPVGRPAPASAVAGKARWPKNPLVPRVEGDPLVAPHPHPPLRARPVGRRTRWFQEWGGDPLVAPHPHPPLRARPVGRRTRWFHEWGGTRRPPRTRDLV
jgi:hypothetical protein